MVNSTVLKLETVKLLKTWRTILSSFLFKNDNTTHKNLWKKHSSLFTRYITKNSHSYFSRFRFELTNGIFVFIKDRAIWKSNKVKKQKNLGVFLN